jgi:cyanophycinase-like exopeptidase
MKKIILFCLVPFLSIAQGYTSYFTGNTTNITTITEFGVCLMGGATEHDNAMKWLLQKANGGDVVVLRSTGSNGYNNYLYTDLGIQVNSVETLVITSVAGATNPYVLDKVSKAEMIWFAGGDQFNYVSFFKNNALEDLLNNHINVKGAPIGGTSAGMAILGQFYFSAQNGSITSSAALANPFNTNVTIGYNDFLNVPFLNKVITDTHYDNPDRKGRHAVFMARNYNALNENVYGIACNEYVAVCIGADGIAKVYGDFPNYQEFAYFIQSNCENTAGPETLQPNTPLTWNQTGKALKVYKVPGTMNGSNYYNVNNWSNGIGFGGNWENWSIVNGTLNVSTGGLPPNCTLNTNNLIENELSVFPNPFSETIYLSLNENCNVELYNTLGKLIYSAENFKGNKIDTTFLSSGLYFIKITSNGVVTTKKLIKD